MVEDARRILREAILARGLTAEHELVLRTDNDPQFTANVFQDECEKLPITHTRIPVNTPNLNAHIESLRNESIKQ